MKRAARAPELRREYERLLGLVLVLVVLGAIWVYSASSSEQIVQGDGDGTSFLIRYVIFGALGFGVLALASRYGVAVLKKLTVPLLIAGMVLSAAVVLPGIGKEVNGAYRWIGAGAIVFQPSELLKTATIAFLALRMATRRKAIRKIPDLKVELGVLLLLIIIVAGIQRDLGTTIVIVGAAVCVLIMGGMPGRFFVPIGAIGAFGLLVLVAMHPYRIARLTSFLSPWADAGGTGYQVTQGQIAIGSGGFLGNGLGSSIQKADWLPEAHTDFILAVVGEELGAIGIIMLLVLYGAIAYTGLRIADRTKGQYQKLLAVGITAIIICQAMLNVWVVLGIFPLTGVPLPFISYGSTNLIVLLGAVGVLLNIARGTPYVETEPLLDPGPRPGRRAPISERDIWRSPGEPRPSRGRGPVRRPALRPVPTAQERPVAPPVARRRFEHDAERYDDGFDAGFEIGASRGSDAERRSEARRSRRATGPEARRPRDASRFDGDAADVRDRSGWDSGARRAGAERRRRAS